MDTEHLADLLTHQRTDRPQLGPPGDHPRPQQTRRTQVQLPPPRDLQLADRQPLPTRVTADLGHVAEGPFVYPIWRSLRIQLWKLASAVTRILVMSKVLPLSEVKAKFSEVVDEVMATQERVTVTRNGRPVAVLVSTDDLETIEETLAILSDPEAVREIEEGRAAVEAGDVMTRDQVQAMRDRLRVRAG